ncbi:MAG TPA: XdhC family protein [Thermoanaerobaculia bacterium]|nr:XdhC family protein [Thermoanaerobaculia bacterium]
MKRATLERLLASARAQQPVVLATDLESGEQRVLEAGEGEAAADALRRDACVHLEEGGRQWFLRPWSPPVRMVLVGAVHIAQPLAAMAALAEYAVTIVDPRRAFATPERFPGVTLLGDWPDQALAALVPDARTAVVTLTHDPKLDDPALVVALRSPAFYVGALGSRKSHAARLERLRALGLTDAELARLHAPVGLAIGARSPAEIAVSILAEVTQQLRRPPQPAA